MICADAFAQGQCISRSLGYMGADFVLSPCAWAVPPGFDNAKTPYGSEWKHVYSPVSRHFSMPIFGVSNVGPIEGGPWSGWNCIGNSIAVDAEGEVILAGAHGVDAEAIFYVDFVPKDRPTRGGGWIRSVT